MRSPSILRKQWCIVESFFRMFSLSWLNCHWIDDFPSIFDENCIIVSASAFWSLYHNSLRLLSYIFRIMMTRISRTILSFLSYSFILFFHSFESFRTINHKTDEHAITQVSTQQSSIIRGPHHRISNISFNHIRL